MSIFKKVTAFLTAVGIAAAFTGCSDTTYGLVVDGVKVPAGVYIYYANSAYSNALSMLKAENAELDTTDTKAVKAATIEGVDTLTWIQDKATELCVNYVAVEKQFDELGLELDSDTKSNLKSMVEYYWASYEESMVKNGVSEDSFTKIMTSSYKSEMLFDYYYGVESENGKTEDELKEYYIDNNIRTQYVAFKLYDGEGNLLKSDGKEDMMDMVKEYKERVEDAYDEGGVEAVMTEMSVVQSEYNAYCTSVSNEAAGITETTTTTTSTTTTTTTTVAVTATETDENGNVSIVEDENNDTAAEATTTVAADSEETETVTVSYPNEKIVPILDTADYEEGEEIPYSPSEKVYNQLMDITEKDYGKPYIVEEDETYYLVVRYDIKDRVNEDDLWNENQIYSVQIDLYNDDFEALIQEWSDALTVEKNASAYKRYDPFKFEFE